MRLRVSPSRYVFAYQDLGQNILSDLSLNLGIHLDFYSKMMHHRV